MSFYLSSAYYEKIILNGMGWQRGSQVESKEGGQRKGEINHKDRTPLCWNRPHCENGLCGHHLHFSGVRVDFWRDSAISLGKPAQTDFL